MRPAIALMAIGLAASCTYGSASPHHGGRHSRMGSSYGFNTHPFSRTPRDLDNVNVNGDRSRVAIESRMSSGWPSSESLWADIPSSGSFNPRTFNQWSASVPKDAGSGLSDLDLGGPPNFHSKRNVPPPHFSNSYQPSEPEYDHSSPYQLEFDEPSHLTLDEFEHSKPPPPSPSYNYQGGKEPHGFNYKVSFVEKPKRHAAKHSPFGHHHGFGRDSSGFDGDFGGRGSSSGGYENEEPPSYEGHTSFPATNYRAPIGSSLPSSPSTSSGFPRVTRNFDSRPEDFNEPPPSSISSSSGFDSIPYSPSHEGPSQSYTSFQAPKLNNKFYVNHDETEYSNRNTNDDYNIYSAQPPSRPQPPPTSNDFSSSFPNQIKHQIKNTFESNGRGRKESNFVEHDTYLKPEEGLYEYVDVDEERDAAFRPPPPSPTGVVDYKKSYRPSQVRDNYEIDDIDGNPDSGSSERRPPPGYGLGDDYENRGRGGITDEKFDLVNHDEAERYDVKSYRTPLKGGQYEHEEPVVVETYGDSYGGMETFSGGYDSEDDSRRPQYFRSGDNDGNGYIRGHSRDIRVDREPVEEYREDGGYNYTPQEERNRYERDDMPMASYSSDDQRTKRAMFGF